MRKNILLFYVLICMLACSNDINIEKNPKLQMPIPISELKTIPLGLTEQLENRIANQYNFELERKKDDYEGNVIYYFKRHINFDENNPDNTEQLTIKSFNDTITRVEYLVHTEDDIYNHLQYDSIINYIMRQVGHSFILSSGVELSKVEYLVDYNIMESFDEAMVYYKDRKIKHVVMHWSSIDSRFERKYWGVWVNNVSNNFKVIVADKKVD